MAEEQHNTVAAEGGEIKDRGLFDFMGKKEEEKPQEDLVVEEVEKLNISDHEEKKPSLSEKFHRSGSTSSSSSSDEEVEEGGEKIKKKKKLKEKLADEKKGEEHDTSIPIEKCEEIPQEEVAVHPEEKKGFLEKIKDKLPGGTHKKPEEAAPVPAPAPAPAPVDLTHASDAETKEKKGLLEKIKEKLPGYHPKTDEDKKESN